MVEREPGNGDVRRAELELLRLKIELGVDVTDAPVVERALVRTLNRIELGEVSQEGRAEAHALGVASHGPRWRVPVFSVVAASLVVALAVGIFVWSAPPALASPPLLAYATDPSDVVNAPLAAEVLRDLADVARSASPVGRDRVQFVATTGWKLAVDGDKNRAAVIPYVRESWIADDGSGRAIEHSSAALLADGTVDPSPAVAGVEDWTDSFPVGSIVDQPSELSRDPDTLRRQLLLGSPAECGDERRVAACLVHEIQSISMVFVIPDDLNEAFWQMLADTPGVHYLGEVSDRIGRPVAAIASEPVETSFESVIDVILIEMATGRVVGEERISLESSLLDIAGPTVTGFTTITESRYVSEIGEH